MTAYQNPRNIGDVGEAYAIAKFTEHGIHISKPLSENCPYDLIADWNGNLYKIQVKTTEHCKNDTMKFNISRNNPYKLTWDKYRKGEIDFFFLYCIETCWCGLISLEEAQSNGLSIHYSFPISNNFNGYKMQQDYEFSYKIREIKENIKVPKHDINELIPKNQQQTNVKELTDSIGDRTTREKLKSEIRSMPFVQVGKLYGVSDNAIRKWCARMGLPDKSTVIKMYSDEEWKMI